MSYSVSPATRYSLNLSGENVDLSLSLFLSRIYHCKTAAMKPAHQADAGSFYRTSFLFSLLFIYLFLLSFFFVRVWATSRPFLFFLRSARVLTQKREPTTTPFERSRPSPADSKRNNSSARLLSWHIFHFSWRGIAHRVPPQNSPRLFPNRL